MNNKRAIRRGDSKSITVEVKQDGVATTVDNIFFTVKTDTLTDTATISKKLSDGITLENNVYTISIEPTDTNELDYGTYYYDIEIIKNSVKKTIEFGYFKIEDEVTFSANEV